MEIELFKSLRSVKDAEDKIQVPRAPVFHSIEYEIYTICEKAGTLDNLNEEEIKNIIIRQHQTILNYDLFLSHNRQTAQKLFTNKRFLQIFLQVGGLIQLNNHEAICINKLAYDYYITENKDEEVSELLLQLCYQLNANLVLRLSAYLGMNGARVLSMIANSSFDDSKRISRVHTFLVKCENVLTVQNMVDIICTIFADRFVMLFIIMMMQTKSVSMTPQQNEHFDNISKAIIAILDSLKTDNIMKVLKEYAYTLLLKRNDIKEVRMSLRSVVNYPRIISAIQSVEQQNKELFVP